MNILFNYKQKCLNVKANKQAKKTKINKHKTDKRTNKQTNKQTSMQIFHALYYSSNTPIYTLDTYYLFELFLHSYFYCCCCTTLFSVPILIVVS